MSKNDTLKDALGTLFEAYGGSKAAIFPNDTASDVILDIAGAIKFGASNVTVASPSASKEYWGTRVSAMQTSVTIANGAVTGTLHKLTESCALVDTWGEGYFIALKFTKNNENITSIKVGLNPSMSKGLVELDADMDGVFKVTNKDVQKFEILCSDGTYNFPIALDLSGLTLD